MCASGVDTGTLLTNIYRRLLVVVVLIHFKFVRTGVEQAYKHQQTYNQQIIKMHLQLFLTKFNIQYYFNVRTMLNVKSFTRLKIYFQCAVFALNDDLNECV